MGCRLGTRGLGWKLGSQSMGSGPPNLSQVTVPGKNTKNTHHHLPSTICQPHPFVKERTFWHWPGTRSVGESSQYVVPRLWV